jgi:putative membrane protein
MDFSWMPYFGGFWIFPLLCLLFMVVMMFACGGKLFRFGHGSRRSDSRETARQIADRRYVNGEISKEQYDAMRRDLNG